MERTIEIAENCTDHKISGGLQFFLVDWLIAQQLHFFINFLNSGFANFDSCFGADKKCTFLYLIQQVTVNAISIAFVFADICHQARTKKSTKNIVQHLHFLKIGMMTIWKIAANTYSSLYSIRVIKNFVFFFGHRRNSMLNISVCISRNM